MASSLSPRASWPPNSQSKKGGRSRDNQDRAHFFFLGCIGTWGRPLEVYQTDRLVSQVSLLASYSRHRVIYQMLHKSLAWGILNR